MNIKIKLKDFKSICRFCLEKEPYMKPIFSNDDDNEDENDDVDEYSISEMIEFCLGIRILADDKLPKCLCKNCYTKLLDCNIFHKKCLSAEETLNNMLKHYDKQNKYKHSIATTVPMKTDPLDFSYTEHTEEICSINEPTIDIKEEKIYEWTETKSNHIDKCEEILSDEIDIRDIGKIENNYLDNKNRKDDLIKEDEKSLNCTKDEKIIKKEKREPKRHQCPICGKLYAKINTHIETHSGAKKHICPHCNKKFSTKHNLNEHINGHFDLRPYKCKLCDKAFNSRKSLYSHDVWHNKEEKYECNICGRKFLYQATYRYHMRVHNQIKKYKCDICNREFIAKYHLVKHYRVHTGERPYKCKECDKSFKTSYSLSAHRKVHTKEISYYCKKCNTGFVYKSTLNSHLKKCQ